MANKRHLGQGMFISKSLMCLQINLWVILIPERMVRGKTMEMSPQQKKRHKHLSLTSECLNVTLLVMHEHHILVPP